MPSKFELTQLIIIVVSIFLFYLQCGMRHPSARKTDDDLSRLTTSSSSSRDQSTSRSFHDVPQLDPAASEFTSTYLPQVIDPIEWQQQSRKRKERQDSTSSITQDRKLVRSNSEEYIPSVDYEVIRRVSSHEDIKNPSDESSLHSLLGEEEDDLDDEAPVVDDDARSFKSANNEVQEILREAHRRAETSPARSRPFDFAQKYGPNRDDSDGRQCRGDYGSDAEGERRRSERFYMARVKPSGRKNMSKKSPAKSRHHRRSESPATLRERNENQFQNCAMESMRSERRGFVSRSGSLKQKENDPQEPADDASNSSTSSSDPCNEVPYTAAKTVEEPRPWYTDHHSDEAPVVCRRFASDTFNHVNNSMEIVSKVRNAANFTKAENMKTCEIMKSVPMPSIFTAPEERLRQINKRLTALKKRVMQFEEVYERENGYRPSPSAKLDDHYMKNAIAEINKLRKEKQNLKADPMATLGYATSQNGGNKVAKMRDTLLEIEKVRTIFNIYRGWMGCLMNE